MKCCGKEMSVLTPAVVECSICDHTQFLEIPTREYRRQVKIRKTSRAIRQATLKKWAKDK